MGSDVLDKLIEKFGRGIVEAAEPYLPALKRMALNELTAVADLIGKKKYDEAKEKIHAAMTPEELAEEKEKLADLAVLMADENAYKRKVGMAIGEAILKTAVSVLLGAILP